MDQVQAGDGGSENPSKPRLDEVTWEAREYVARGEKRPEHPHVETDRGWPEEEEKSQASEYSRRKGEKCLGRVVITWVQTHSR